MSELPLAGCRVLVTRAEDQAGELVRAIESAGGQAIRFPVLTISGHDAALLASEFAALPAPDLIIFVSPNAVRFGVAATRMSTARVAAVGPATARALQDAGVKVDIVPAAGFDSEHLLAHPDLQIMSGRSVVIVRGERGRELLGNALRARGAVVNYLSAYRRAPNRPPAATIARLDDDWRNGRVDCVTVMSVETLENLLAALPPASLALLGKTPLVAPGDRVIQTACELVPGIPAITAPGPTAADMLNALIEWRHSGKN